MVKVPVKRKLVECPICHMRTEQHCESPACPWWRCTGCTSFGNGKRTVDATKLERK